MAVSGTVVISQVYGGGGNSGATYRNDFIEIFNRGTSTVDLTGWTVQYGAPSSSTWSATSLAGTIPPGGYYLIQEAQGAGGTTDLPTPDAVGSIAMNATSGKVALVNSSTLLSGACPSDVSIVDLVGYGSANCSEGSATGSLDNLTAALRHFDGCADTDNNSADFAGGAPTPRNSASLTRSCQYTLTLNVDPVAGGSVTPNPSQGSYQHGTTVQLTAVAAVGYSFVNWTGDAGGNANPLIITMDGDKTVTAHFAQPSVTYPIVISQVYGGGGNAGATYKNDFIELFNRGNATVDVSGWTVQYAAATGAGWSSTTLLGSIPPGRYYLVAEAQGSGGTADLPAPDAVGSIELNAVAGKVALVNGSGLLTGTCPSGGGIQDMVGYGLANCAEGSATGSLDNATAALRNSDGCDDTDDNLADFSGLNANPRNSASPFKLCAFWAGVDNTGSMEFGLRLLSPNPTHGMLYVRFALPRESDLKLRLYDLQGRAVYTLADSRFAAGRHEIAWNAAGAGGAVRPGMYFVRMQALGREFTRSVIITR
jgi:uncharacterized repeat protein (TIGR02543 family)